MKVNNAKKNVRNQLVPAAVFLLAVLMFPAFAFAQAPKATPPSPGEPSPVNIPAVQESKLKNNLPVAVIERKNVPLVTVRLLIKNGADKEAPELAGLADVTASLLTKGTKTRSASQLAEQIEFLGGTIESGSDWNSTQITVNVTSDKLETALAIMADAILNPKFDQKEIDLHKKQVLDSLSVSLKQPATLANYVASRFSFGEHDSNGTPETIERISRKNILDFYSKFYAISDSVLIFTGDVSQKEATALSTKYFGKWKNPKEGIAATRVAKIETNKVVKSPVFDRILVVDLPKSGQASVSYVKKLENGRNNCDDDNNCVSGYYYSAAAVLNSVLGGGYSSRLNQEIRIKRGLSYGARSDFDWRNSSSNFSASTQTKNESAGEVADLIKIEIEKLAKEDIASDDLTPRKAVLTGSFGRSLETNNGLMNRISELYLYGLSVDELKTYMKSIDNVSGENIKSFSAKNLFGGDLIIVGDASVFMDDLTKRFSETPIDVISIDDLDLNRRDLRKSIAVGSEAPAMVPAPPPTSTAPKKKSKPRTRGIDLKGKSDADKSDPPPTN